MGQNLSLVCPFSNHTHTPSQSDEDLVDTYQHQVSLALAEDLLEESSLEAQSYESAREEVAIEMESLLRSTLASLEGGNLATPTREGLLSEYSGVREASVIKERQISQVKSRMEQKMRERRKKLHSKQEDNRSKVGAITDI